MRPLFLSQTHNLLIVSLQANYFFLPRHFNFYMFKKNSSYLENGSLDVVIYVWIDNQ